LADDGIKGGGRSAVASPGIKEYEINGWTSGHEGVFRFIVPGRSWKQIDSRLFFRSFNWL
jgi:hypothetical protein